MSDLYADLEAAHKEYRRAAEDIEEDVARHRDELLAPAREALSQKMHRAHAAGLSKDRIRRAVRAYNNASVFDPLWDAHVPQEEVDLRKKKTMTMTSNGTWGWLDDGSLMLTLTDGTTRTLEGVALTDGEYVDWTGSEDMATDEHLSEVMRLALAAAKARDEGESE